MFDEILTAVNSFVWGPVMLVLILGTGVYLMLGLGFMPLRRLGYGFRQLFAGRSASGDGDISPFNALMTSLSATVGTGNIVGVATAVTIGGPGALFWMWCTALVGMATKYAEAVLAVQYREVDARGQRVGGPMYYIRNGLGKNWAWLGFLFAVFGTFAGFGIGNSVQANSVADAMNSTFSLPLWASSIVSESDTPSRIPFPEWLTGLILATLVGLVLIGGIKRIANVAGRLVPFMALLYLVSASVILVIHIADIPAALVLIVKSAFTGAAAEGGFAGATIMLAIRMGVARGVFSNEAGLGSAPIAHAAAQTNSPVRQGSIAMLGTFIDTIVICTLTGLALAVTGAWHSGEEGAAVTTLAFRSVFGFGDQLVSICLALFAFTTILGWSYYSERCAEYLCGVRVITAFRCLWVLAVFGGAVIHLDQVWAIADTLNGMMAIPNLVALLLLSPVVFRLTREYFGKGGEG